MYHQLNRFKLRALSALMTGMLTASLAWAVDPFTVRDIRVEGLQRVEPGTIFASMPLRVGETYNDDKGSAAIRALFSLGLFKDVRLEVNGDVLVVIVEERPTVAGVEFVGTKEFDKDFLKKAMRDSGLFEGQPFDKALADKAEQELKRQYVNRSLYGAQVVTTVTPIERNRVNLTFSVTEGETAKIKDIRLVGYKAFSESTLRKLFDLDTGGWLSWYTKSDRYSRVKLNADIETLRSYYLSRGYLDFRVESTQVAISQLPGPRRRVQVARYSQARCRLQRRPCRRNHQGLQRVFRHLRFCLRARRSPACDRPKKQSGQLCDAGRPIAPRLCAPHQYCRQQPHP